MPGLEKGLVMAMNTVLGLVSRAVRATLGAALALVGRGNLPCLPHGLLLVEALRVGAVPPRNCKN
jgi:hypothetical protein